MSEAAQQRRAGAIVLAQRPGENHISAQIENSFSMSWSTDHARFYFSGKAYDNVFGIEWTLDGMKDALEQVETYAARNPDWEIRAWDVDDPDLPVVLDWASHAAATSKWYRRNVPFTMKGEDNGAAPQVEGGA